MSATDIHFFFTLRSQIKLYHWQTYQFARHKATDDLITALDELMDNYVEVYMGKYGRPKMTSTTNSTSIKNMSESTAVSFVRGAIKYLETTIVKRLKPTDTDLVNIRDEMLSNLNKLLYLFTLK